MFIIVAFPVCEFPELRRYVAPVRCATGYPTLEAAEESARISNIIENGEHFTFEAMSQEQFNNLDWPTIELFYGPMEAR